MSSSSLLSGELDSFYDSLVNRTSSTPDKKTRKSNNDATENCKKPTHAAGSPTSAVDAPTATATKPQNGHDDDDDYDYDYNYDDVKDDHEQMLPSASGHSLGKLVDWSMDFYDDEEDALEDAIMMMGVVAPTSTKATTRRTPPATNDETTIEFLESIHEIVEDGDEDEESTSQNNGIGGRLRAPPALQRQRVAAPSSSEGDTSEDGDTDFNMEDFVVSRLGLGVDEIEGKFNSLYEDMVELKKKVDTNGKPASSWVASTDDEDDSESHAEDEKQRRQQSLEAQTDPATPIDPAQEERVGDASTATNDNMQCTSSSSANRLDTTTLSKERTGLDGSDEVVESLFERFSFFLRRAKETIRRLNCTYCGKEKHQETMKESPVVSAGSSSAVIRHRDFVFDDDESEYTLIEV